MHDRAYEDMPDMTGIDWNGPTSTIELPPGVTYKYANPLLNERERTHGDFEEKALLIQNIKGMLRFEAGWERLTPAQQEALDMIVSKIGRIMTGDATTEEHWDDIAGYAGLGKASIIRTYNTPRL